MSKTIDNETEINAYITGSNLMSSISGANSMTFTHDENGNTTQMGEMLLGYGENNRLNKVAVKGSELEGYVIMAAVNASSNTRVIIRSFIIMIPMGT